MFRFLNYIILILVSGLFFSCQKDNQKDHPFNYVNIEFYEQRITDGQTLYFNLSSLETFPCSNFTLNVTVNTSANHTDIRISDIAVPDNCITSMGPATQLISLGKFDNYDKSFTLWVNDKRHDFRLDADNQLITVKKGNNFQNHLIFAFDSLYRIPAHTVWGFAAFNNKELWDEIYAAFIAAGGTEFLLANGNYYFFTIKDGSIVFENTKQKVNESFYFHFNQPIEVLTEIFRQIIQKYPGSDVQLRLINSLGERYVL
jgi:hypothetical protein